MRTMILYKTIICSSWDYERKKRCGRLVLSLFLFRKEYTKEKEIGQEILVRMCGDILLDKIVIVVDLEKIK